MRKFNQNEKNPMWKGDKVGIKALHNWVRRHKPKPSVCEACNFCKPFDLANISQKYKRDVNDYEWLCRRCHMTKDNRLETWQKLNHSRSMGERKCKTCGVIVSDYKNRNCKKCYGLAIKGKNNPNYKHGKNVSRR